MIPNPFGSQILFAKLDYHSQALEVNTTPQNDVWNGPARLVAPNSFLFSGSSYLPTPNFMHTIFAQREIPSKFAMHLHCLIPSKMGNFDDPCLKISINYAMFLLLLALRLALQSSGCLVVSLSEGQTHRGTAPNAWISDKLI